MAKKAKRKIRKSKRFIIPIMMVILIAGYFFGKEYYQEQKQIEAARRANYAAFGIDIPLNYTIHGIDISSHQNFVHWPAIKKMNLRNVQVKFVFIKATEGLTDIDQQFKRNWSAAKENGITRGAYHYFISTKSGKDQAANFIKNVNLAKGDLPPVVDIEELYGIDPVLMRTRVKEYLQTIETHYGIKPIIYSNADFYERNMGTAFDDFPLWVANYQEKEKPHIKRDWLFWQHADQGRVNGITTNVDFNVFKGDSVTFNQILVQY